MKSIVCAAVILMAISLCFANSVFAQCDGKTGLALAICRARQLKSPKPTDRQPLSPHDFQQPPLTTGIRDVVGDAAQRPGTEAASFEPLRNLPRTDDGSFVLAVGAFEAVVEAYPLDAFVGMDSIGGLRPATIKGGHAQAIATTLKLAGLHPEVRAPEIQALLSAIVGKTDFAQWRPAVQNTAATILPGDALDALRGSRMLNVGRSVWSVMTGGKEPPAPTVHLPTPPKETEPILSALAAAPMPIARGTWTQLPNGAWIRYLLEGPSKVRLQLMVPDDAFQNQTPLLFDPTAYVAISLGTSIQRFGVTLRPAR